LSNRNKEQKERDSLIQSDLENKDVPQSTGLNYLHWKIFLSEKRQKLKDQTYAYFREIVTIIKH